MFYVGQKVVCVDDADTEKYNVLNYIKLGDMHGLKAGVVYTVRAVGRRVPEECECLWLSEITRPLLGSACKTLGECGFAAARFRPVVERKTDISIFKAMLNPSDKRVDA